jgi:preprotein translocase subunit SecF
MDPAIKKVAIVIALALVVVLGLIFVTNGARGKDAQVATANSVQTAEKTAQTPDTQEADAKTLPAEVADASEVSKTNEAQIEDDAQEIEMYEGALAGLSEEEIANMALAEEEGAARGETTGIEDAID